MTQLERQEEEVVGAIMRNITALIAEAPAHSRLAMLERIARYVEGECYYLENFLREVMEDEVVGI